MFAVAHPIVGSKLLARFDGPLVEWTASRDDSSWHAERKDARAAFRLAWQASASERRYRLDFFRDQERQARDAFAAAELSQGAQAAERGEAPSDEQRQAREDELFRALARIELDRAAAEDKADDNWIDLGSEAVLFEKPDSLLTSPGFALFGFVKEGNLWAGFDWDGQVEFSDSGSRMALFQTEAMAMAWAKESLKGHPEAALATLRAEFSNLRPAFALEAQQSQQWILDVLAQQEGALAKPDKPRAGHEPAPSEKKRARSLALGKKEKKEAKDRATGRFDAALTPAKEPRDKKPGRKAAKSAAAASQSR